MYIRFTYYNISFLQNVFKIFYKFFVKHFFLSLSKIPLKVYFYSNCWI